MFKHNQRVGRSGTPIVGCGRISKNHFGSIEAHADNLELAAVCDIDPVRLAEHEQKIRRQRICPPEKTCFQRTA